MAAHDGLGVRVARGGAWMFALRGIAKVLDVIKLAVVARILAPGDLGLFGVALLTQAVLETFSTTGFQAALVQRRRAIEGDLDAVWTILALRGLALCALTYAAAPLAAAFFDTPAATPLIRVMGVAFVIRGFANPGTISFERDLEFGRQFRFSVIPGLATFIASVAAVIALRSVWALAIGQLVGYAAGFIAGYALHPYRPRPTADWARARELWRFGRWVLVSAILGLLLGQGDDLFVGKMLGATALGLYQMAYRIASIPATEFAQRLAIVLFPAYSALQHDRPRLRNAYLKALRLSALVCFPVTGGLVVLAGDFTALLLGENWLAAVPVIRALALVGLLNSLVNARPLLLAMGRPEVNTRLQVLRLALIAVLIYPLTAGLGMVGTGAALCASALITETLALLTVLRLLGLPRRRAAGPLLLPMSSAAVMMGVVYALASWGVPGSRLAGFGLLILAGAAVYGGLALLHDVLFRTGNLALIREQLRALRGGGPGARR